MAKKGDYAVGYGKPPIDKRFQKGTSPNPNGRPVGSKNKETPDTFSKMLQEEASRFIEVREKGKATKMKTNRAIMRQVLIAAANGNLKAQKLALEIISKDENRRAAENAQRFDAADDFKKWWAEDSKRRKLRGEPEPNFRFHPDNFHLDYANGTVTYLGLTPDQKTYVDMINRMKEFFEAALLGLVEEETPSGEEIEWVWDELKYIVSVLSKLNKSMGMPWSTEFPKFPDMDEVNEVEKRVMKELGIKKTPKRAGS
ncbi:MAG: DUF5681 domain-containing protein [Chloroflexia bacterium]